jgi:hypothetical protein
VPLGDMKTNKSTNQGYKIVEKTDRGYAGRFNSPYSEPMGKSLSLRFPESLDEFLEEEMAKTGMTKTSLIREAVRLMKQSKK